jgi:hypothetical protein
LAKSNRDFNVLQEAAIIELDVNRSWNGTVALAKNRPNRAKGANKINERFCSFGAKRRLSWSDAPECKLVIQIWQGIAKDAILVTAVLHGSLNSWAQMTLDKNVQASGELAKKVRDILGGGPTFAWTRRVRIYGWKPPTLWSRARSQSYLRRSTLRR